MATKKTPAKQSRGRPRAERPLGHTLSVRIGGPLYEAFMAKAKRERRKPSDLLRILVEDALTAAGDFTPED